MFVWLKSIPTARFNAICLMAMLLLLSLVVAYRLSHRFNYQDFPQYYMGGLMARHNQWSELYPTAKPTEGVIGNIGMEVTSQATPTYLELAKPHDVPVYVLFIQCPTAAILFIPLTWLPVKSAFWLWSLLQVIAAGMTAWIAGWTFAQCLGRESKWQGLLTLLFGLSPLAYWSVRIANVTTIVAGGTALAMVALIGRRSSLGTLGLASSTIMKYSPAILWPIAIIRHRWKMVFGLPLLLFLAFALTLPMTGLQPWVDYFQRILPGADRVIDMEGNNQSLSGMVCRLLNSPAGLNTDIHRGLRLFSLIILLGLGGVIWHRRRDIARSIPMTLAATSALLAWWPLAAPIYWEHYHLGLVPCFGWLAWEMTRSRWRRIAGLIALLGLCVPVVIIKTIPQPEPIRSAMFLCSQILLVMAIIRLIQGHWPDRSDAVESDSHHPPPIPPPTLIPPVSPASSHASPSAPPTSADLPHR